MDITDIENLKFIIPIMGVIGLGSFIFLFGFKHSVTPPSFEDLIDLDNKKSKKKKTKYDKLKIANSKPKDVLAKKSVAPSKSKKDDPLSALSDTKEGKKVVDKKEKNIKKEDPKGKKPTDLEKTSAAMEGWMTIPPRKDKKVVAPATKQGGRLHLGTDEGRSSTSPEFMSHSESSDHVQEVQRRKGGINQQEVAHDKKKNATAKGKDKVKGKDGNLMHTMDKISEKSNVYDDLDVEAGTYYDYDGYNDDQPQYLIEHSSTMEHPKAREPVTKTTHADTFAMDANHPAAKPGLNKGQPNINYPSFSSSGSSATSRDTIANEWELVNHPTLVDGPREHDAMSRQPPAPPAAVKPILTLTLEEEWMGMDHHSQLQQQHLPLLPSFGCSLSAAATPSILADHGSDAWLNNYSSYLMGVPTTGAKEKSPVERALLEEIKRKRDVLRDRVPEAFTFEDDHPSDTSHVPPKQQQAARETNSSAGGGGGKQPYYQPDAHSPDEAVRGILPEAYGGPKKVPKKKALPNGIGHQNTLAEPVANGEPGTVKKAAKKKKKKPNTAAPLDGVVA